LPTRRSSDLNGEGFVPAVEEEGAYAAAAAACGAGSPRAAGYTALANVRHCGWLGSPRHVDRSAACTSPKPNGGCEPSSSTGMSLAFSLPMRASSRTHCERVECWLHSTTTLRLWSSLPSM